MKSEFFFLWRRWWCGFVASCIDGTSLRFVSNHFQRLPSSSGETKNHLLFKFYRVLCSNFVNWKRPSFDDYLTIYNWCSVNPRLKIRLTFLLSNINCKRYFLSILNLNSILFFSSSTELMLRLLTSTPSPCPARGPPHSFQPTPSRNLKKQRQNETWRKRFKPEANKDCNLSIVKLSNLHYLEQGVKVAFLAHLTFLTWKSFSNVYILKFTF